MKTKIKVEVCDEFKCPFFHAGHMGSLMCTVLNRDVTEYTGEKPPDWCPLRLSNITVKLR